MVNIFVDPDAVADPDNPPGSVKVGATCYELVGESDTAIDTASVDSEHTDCDDCDPPAACPSDCTGASKIINGEIASFFNRFVYKEINY